MPDPSALLARVKAMHKRRTERHGSGCVQCGIVWPCPTYRALDESQPDPTPEIAERLSRIAGAHSKNHVGGGLTSGDCNECGHPHPCPTYTWATTDRNPLATWDPADDEPEYEPCPAGPLPQGDAPVERCIVEGVHKTHVTAMGRRWTDTPDTEEA